LCRVESNFEVERGDPRPLGFDAAIEFQPDALALGTPAQRTSGWERLRTRGRASPAFASHHIWDYGQVAKTMLAKKEPDYPRFPGIMTGFDSSPRRKERAHIFRNATPELYQAWLHTLVERVNLRPVEERIVFVNAWNEWAEGAYLEPDARYGRTYLEATRSALG
jgi:hypothetical protein